MLTLLRHADLYAPHAVGLRDLLIGGGQVLAIGKNLLHWAALRPSKRSTSRVGASCPG